MYKLIAIDMDGTLLKDDKTISDENIAAIKKATDNGVKIALATGRPIKGIEKYLKQLNLISDSNYAVGFNGAVVENTKNHKVISEILLSPDDIKYIHKLSRAINVNIQIALKESSITPVRNKYSELDARLNNINLYIDNFENISEDEHILKAMFMDDDYKLSHGIPNLPKDIYEKYTVVRSEPWILEFMNKSANKAEGVKTLGKKFGIDRSEVICIGDSFNDIHMIKYAGLGVAMKNAFPEIKSHADYITKTNEENGVAYAINKFIFDK
ncbi:Cof-type HAD-IIB family hydrolase [Clostridium tyrobutyricum]|uniref:Cof-type HAD-IIB family hydrolase n=1 Tax=Clostridium tyrobutyricum TaxID=1519 RepID=UPI001C383AA8|nr:Cof-type HAD-IIB family hydrolase [Clostridium tyrobutyricum]MBV4431113.1 Cof-type HAD-IIB family hydrolase [Clostridium tyrobutyricum]